MTDRTIARRGRRKRLALELSELIEAHSVEGAAALIGITPQRLRRWRRIPASPALQRWLEQRLPRRTLGGLIWRVVPPRTSWPCFRSFHRAACQAHRLGEPHLLAELQLALERA